MDRAKVKSILLDGARARDVLIRSNVKLVVSITKRWARMSAMQDGGSLYSIYSGGWDRPSVTEAVQEGILGLTKAAERFQPKRGLRFSTYATYWVVNSVRQCFKRATTGVMRVPTNYYDTRMKYRALVKFYYDTEGMVPQMDVLAKELNIALPRLQKILTMTQPLLSTDQPRRMGGTTRGGKNEDHLLISDTLVDADAPPEDRVELSFLRQSLENAMATELAPHERDVIRLRLGLDDGVARTCRQVAEEYGGRLTSSEVRSTEKRALQKLRSPQSLATYKLLAYLDFAGVDRETVSFR
jgi:RNA polymerase primary sigma factor